MPDDAAHRAADGVAVDRAVDGDGGDVRADDGPGAGADACRSARDRSAGSRPSRRRSFRSEAWSGTRTIRLLPTASVEAPLLSDSVRPLPARLVTVPPTRELIGGAVDGHRGHRRRHRRCRLPPETDAALGRGARLRRDGHREGATAERPRGELEGAVGADGQVVAAFVLKRQPRCRAARPRCRRPRMSWSCRSRSRWRRPRRRSCRCRSSPCRSGWATTAASAPSRLYDGAVGHRGGEGEAARRGHGEVVTEVVLQDQARPAEAGHHAADGVAVGRADDQRRT